MSAYLPAIAAGAAAQSNVPTQAQFQAAGFIPQDVPINQTSIVNQGPSLSPWLLSGFGSANPFQSLGGYALPAGASGSGGQDGGGSSSSDTPAGLSPAPAGQHWEYTGQDANGGYGLVATDSNSQENQLMTALHKYDPNASISTSYGGDQPNLQSTLNFDPTMIPGADGIHSLMAKSQFNNYNSLPLSEREMGANLPFTRTPTDTSQMFNPHDVYTGNTWGNITPTLNVKPQQLSPFDKIMEMATMATLGGAFGAAGAGALGSVFGGGAMGNALGSAAGKFGMQEIMSGGHASINPLQLAGSIAGGIPGVGSVMGQISPYLSTGANIYNAVNGSPWGLISQGAGMAGNIIRGH
ncbi:MAG: hypothetical protein ACYC9R_13145 [Nitrosotalea sp.]